MLSICKTHINSMTTILNLCSAPQYLKILARWHHAEWSRFNPGENIQQRIERMQPCLENEFLPSTYIATSDKLLGSAAIVMSDMSTRPELSPWLASVYVRPDDRNRGIGSKLVLHVMKQARNNGIETVFLFTPDKAHFYMNLGWEIINIEQYHGQQVTVMKANLIGN